MYENLKSSIDNINNTKHVFITFGKCYNSLKTDGINYIKMNE